jgi:lysophospholipase L1-like esterase
VLGAVQRNVTRILSLIRDKAHYAGQLVLVSYYSTDYSSNLVTFASTALNAALQRAAQGFDVRVADGFGVIKRAARTAHGNTCTARLLTRTPSGTSPCGVHPSARGQALLAKAVEHAITR